MSGSEQCNLNQYQLNEAPSDSISNLQFLTNSDQHLVAASWDGTVRLFDVQSNSLSFVHRQDEPILGCTALNDDKVCFGGLDNNVSMLDLRTGEVSILGSHGNTVRSLGYSETTETLISGSWDSSIILWDSKSNAIIKKYDQVEEVFCVAVKDELVIVATAENHISIYDLRTMWSPLCERTSEMSLYQTRSISISPDKMIYAVGTIEGRISIEHILAKNQGENYCFRGHYTKYQDGVNVFHPVNAISFHPNKYLCTGGSEGKVYVWNPNLKRRILAYSTYANEISALNYSDNGNLLAIGCSYLHDRVSPPHFTGNQIFVRRVEFPTSTARA